MDSLPTSTRVSSKELLWYIVVHPRQDLALGAVNRIPYESAADTITLSALRRIISGIAIVASLDSVLTFSELLCQIARRP